MPLLSRLQQRSKQYIANRKATSFRCFVPKASGEYQSGIIHLVILTFLLFSKTVAKLNQNTRKLCKWMYKFPIHLSKTIHSLEIKKMEEINHGKRK
jgi:hypothetical protein